MLRDYHSSRAVLLPAAAAAASPPAEVARAQRRALSALAAVARCVAQKVASTKSPPEAYSVGLASLPPLPTTDHLIVRRLMAQVAETDDGVTDDCV